MVWKQGGVLRQISDSAIVLGSPEKDLGTMSGSPDTV